MTSQLAGGQTTAYLYLVARVPMHYEFTAWVNSSDQNVSAVLFRLNEIEGNHELTESGTLAAGTGFALSGGCNHNNGTSGGSAGWNYAPQLTPLSVPPRFTQAQKGAFYQCFTATGESAQETLAQAKSAADSQMARALLNTFDLQSAAAEYLYTQYLDPLDTNYTVLAQVAFPAFTPLAASNHITPLEAQALCASTITLGPAEFLHGQTGMPYLGHMDDFVTFELHHIDVVGAHPTSRRRNRAARAGMGTVENSVGQNVVPRFVGSE